MRCRRSTKLGRLPRIISRMSQYKFGNSSLLKLALPLTIQHAFSHPFYRNYWQDAGFVLNGLPSDPDELTSLHDELPTITKEQLRQYIPPILDAADEVARLVHTSGTTGEPAYRYRSKRELELLSELQSPTTSVRRVGLRLYAPFHGTGGEEREGDAYIFSGSVLDDYLLKRSIDKLVRTFDIPNFPRRLTFLHGAERYLRVFTQAIIDGGLERDAFEIQSIVSYAGFMATESHAYLSEFWRVPIWNRYSSSDVWGGAAVCGKCGHLKFDPSVLVTLDGPNLALRSGGDTVVGLLCFTELFPHGYAQPLVKYKNGDIGEVLTEETACCAAHVGGVRHLGRVQDSIFLPNGSLLLGSGSFKEAMYCPQVRKSFEFSQLTTVLDRRKLGYPLASARLENDGTTISVRCNPGMSSGDAMECIRERLLASSAHLRQTVNDRTVDLRVVFDDKECNALNK